MAGMVDDNDADFDNDNDNEYDDESNGMALL